MSDFNNELYLEFLSEASFLEEQRIGLFKNPEITWLDFDDFEQRFEAHIDGLVVGEEEALNICEAQAIEGDAGELHAAIRVFCRQKRLDILQEVLKKVEPDETEKWQAIEDALKNEMPPDWMKKFPDEINDDNHPLFHILPAVAGYQRLKIGSGLLSALQKNTDSTTKVKIILALGRLHEAGAREPLLKDYLNYHDASVRAATALTLLRLGEPLAINHCLAQVQAPWSHIPLALGSGSSTASALLSEIIRMQSSSINASAGLPSTDSSGIAWTAANTDESLLALGISGNVATVPVLLSLISDSQKAPTAALSLNLITGADLYETVFIPEPIDEDELFEDELEKYKKGEPLYPEGEEPGYSLTRLSLKYAEWQAWWDQNKSRFDSRLRYRNGKPFSPSCLLENLESEKSSPVIRQLAYEELVIRYGIDFPFETDMLVVQQNQALSKYAEWINTNENRFQPGVWYFAARLVP